jgi:hypothetical protein
MDDFLGAAVGVADGGMRVDVAIGGTCVDVAAGALHPANSIPIKSTKYLVFIGQPP